MMYTCLNVREDTHRRIKELALERQCTMDDVVRDALGMAAVPGYKQSIGPGRKAKYPWKTLKSGQWLHYKWHEDGLYGTGTPIGNAHASYQRHCAQHGKGTEGGGMLAFVYNSRGHFYVNWPPGLLLLGTIDNEYWNFDKLPKDLPIGKPFTMKGVWARRDAQLQQ